MCLPLLWLAACARRPEAPGIERLAVLRFENLGTDQGTDWMGRALAEILSTELAGAPGTYAIPSPRLHALGQTLGRRPVAAPGISAEAPLALAAGANRLAYGQYYVERGTIHASLTIEDPRTRRMLRVLHATAPAPDVAAAAAALARQIWPEVRPYAVHDAAAIQAYASAIEAPDPKAEEGFARQAIAADSDFGEAYLLLADLKARERDRDGLMQVLEAASARGTALPEADRARLEVLTSSLSGDWARREQALAVEVHLTPNDPAAWRGLAEVFSARHQDSEAARAYQRALTIEPEDASSWNQLAYAAASAGDLPAATAAVRRYQALRPGEPNPLDSLGDVNLMLGRLKEAEQSYLEAAKISPAFLNGGDYFKAAMAHLMTGDTDGADLLYAKYPGAALHRAEWLWLSGRRRQGYALLSAQVGGLPPGLQPNAYAELAVWSLLNGDRPSAARMAEKAGAGVLGVLARFLAQPPAEPAEWTARARQLFSGAVAGGNPGPSDLALAYAFLLNHQFQPAAGLLRRIYDNAGASPEAGTPVELAWALIETGNYRDAAPLLQANLVPPVAGPNALQAISFPRIFRLRAQLAEKEGRAEQARANQHLFELLSAQ